MNRPTGNDIAREADVCVATVGRVLNARSRVKEKTVAAGHEAIDRLGHVRDIVAANLARQRQYRFVAALPDGDSQFIESLDQALVEAAQAATVSWVTLEIIRFPAEDAHQLPQLLGELSPGGTQAEALTAPETPVLRYAVRALRTSCRYRRNGRTARHNSGDPRSRAMKSGSSRRLSCRDKRRGLCVQQPPFPAGMRRFRIPR
ncbi:MAG: LacI family DNA-binding transcriptional regulator [Tabrizicola sp.]|nr:LacI family DNA-binding transcriptional regulator [Tabrizicola sp.]